MSNTLKSAVMQFLAVGLFFSVVTAFSPRKALIKTRQESHWNHADSIDKIFVKTNEDVTVPCLFDTANIFETYWHNTNLFSYFYPVKTEIPDSMYFIMRKADNDFCIPRMGGINSPFGPRWGKIHKGLDIHLVRGDEVKACMSGKVRYAQFNTGGYGNLVIIRHSNGLETYYAHLSEIKVTPNQWVSAGKVIGNGGNTGAEWSGDHLHFEMRYRDRAFDPLLIIDWSQKKLKSDTLVLYKKHLSVSDEWQKQLELEKKDTPNPERRAVESSTPTFHRVKLGDTVYGISRKYGKSQARILSLNGLTAESELTIGQKIRLD